MEVFIYTEVLLFRSKSLAARYSTECYRDFFVDEALVPFMSRSVSLLEELARTPG